MMSLSNYQLRMRYCLCFATLLSLAISSQALAYKLTFFYDPDTGNVSFDSTDTRTGGITSYYLRIYPDETTVRFREENHIILTLSTLTISRTETVQEVMHSVSMEGLFTIGDVLPTGLTETVWANTFPSISGHYTPQGTAGYTSGLGLPITDPIEYVYGHPGREFDNKWDLVDPDTLPWATTASLIYREGSGEVLLDTRGSSSGYISGIYLRSDGQFLPDEFIPPWESLHSFATENGIDQFGNAIEPGLYSLGNVLEAGLTENEYESLFTAAKFISRAGFEGGDLDLGTEGQAFALVYAAIPEPTTFMMMSLAGVAFLGSRRKRVC